MSKIKSKIITMIKRNYILKNIAKRTYYRQFFNKIRKKTKGNNNIIKYNFTSVLNNVSCDIIGNNNTIIIENNCILKDVKFRIRGNNHSIYIGRNVLFNRGSMIWIEDENGKISIGDYSTFEDVHIAVTESNSYVNIGNDCMFAYDIDIRTGDSHSIVDCITEKRLNNAKSITIGNHVWVGAHCIILKGSSILDNCVLATGSVLTKPISNTDVIIAGNPAKIIKTNINWKRERI